MARDQSSFVMSSEAHARGFPSGTLSPSPWHPHLSSPHPAPLPQGEREEEKEPAPGVMPLLVMPAPLSFPQVPTCPSRSFLAGIQGTGHTPE